MQRRRRLLILAFSAAIILVTAALLALAAGAGRASVIQAGDLWINDGSPGQIWQVHPPSGVYTVYGGLAHPGAARSGGVGSGGIGANFRQVVWITVCPNNNRQKRSVEL